MQQTVEGVMTDRKGSRMGGLGKLSDFGKTSKPKQEPEATSSPEKVSSSELEVSPSVRQKQQSEQEKLVNINVKITRTSQTWLSQTARTVRDNNDTPVAPSVRVFPQHLIGVAIDLLHSTDIDWNTIRNIEDLRQQLKL
jgi:hypothetical protein